LENNRLSKFTNCGQPSFKIKWKGDDNMREKVEAVLGNIRPALQNDGGDVELVEVTDDGIVKVRLQGACGGCPMASMTLKNGIERVLKESIPEVKEVVAV
jgi:Fe-S cluster biogenesis protein NfuA